MVTQQLTSTDADTIPSSGRMLYLHALSPLHTGIGQSVDTIDLPIARERITNWPYVPGSSVKGVLRDACRGNVAEAELVWAFGPETVNASDHAGGVWFADARLLCLPVRSLAGSFAWVTCPMVLRRWRRDYATAGLEHPVATIPDPEPDQVLVTNAGSTTIAIADGEHPRVYLEDLDLSALSSDDALAVAEHIALACFPVNDGDWMQEFIKRFAIVHDDVFGFLAETATEITARIKLDPDSKTVDSKTGALWYEEALPAESILTCPVIASRQRALAAERKAGAENGVEYLLGVVRDGLTQPIQIGGKASVGRGLVRAQLSGEARS